METQLKALGQWEIIGGTAQALTPTDPATPTPVEAHKLAAWKLCMVHAYAKFALQVEDNIGDVFTTTDNPCDTWIILETSHGSHQSGIQAVINTKLTLT